MKRLLACFALLFASVAGATTLSPIQLLNPAGSTSGQVIVSSGASTAPAWGTVPAADIAPITANSLLGNATGSTATPTAIAVPSCSATGSALKWTSGTGFTCATGYAPLASPTFTGTVTAAALTATGAITPSSTAGIVGTTTNDSANAGSIGEYQTASTSGTSLTTGVTANAASIPLAAGDWDVEATVRYNAAGTTTVAAVTTGVNSVSATFGGVGTYQQISANLIAGTNQVQASPVVRESLPTPTTVYAPAQATFGVSTMTVDGVIRARRVR